MCIMGHRECGSQPCPWYAHPMQIAQCSKWTFMCVSYIHMLVTSFTSKCLYHRYLRNHTSIYVMQFALDVSSQEWGRLDVVLLRTPATLIYRNGLNVFVITQINWKPHLSTHWAQNPLLNWCNEEESYAKPSSVSMEWCFPPCRKEQGGSSFVCILWKYMDLPGQGAWSTTETLKGVSTVDLCNALWYLFPLPIVHINLPQTLWENIDADFLWQEKLGSLTRITIRMTH